MRNNVQCDRVLNRLVGVGDQIVETVDAGSKIKSGRWVVCKERENLSIVLS